jgi:beta-glucosidase
MGFSKDFIWGAAAASAQIEGGWNEGGRTPSIWDVAPEGKIKNGDTCHVACDHYHRMREDVALMREMGLKAYRFSVSWSRVIPEEGKVNPEGIKFYSDLIDELIANGIEPLLTIYHWDMPTWVYKIGGWMSKNIITHFAEYTRVLVESFSDRVKWWMPMNEPGCFIMNGHMQGVHAPFKRNYLALSNLTRNCMLANAEAVKAIRKYAKQPVKVGVAFSSGAYVPDNETPEEIERARMLSMEKGCGLMGNRWWMDPMLAGKPVRAYGIYSSRKRDMEHIYQEYDFVGLNIYTSYNYAEWGFGNEKPLEDMKKNSLGWIIDPRCMYWNVKFVYEKYGLPIMITENGLAANDVVNDDGRVYDPDRAEFMKGYLSALKRAANEGIPVLGYLHWSVMDNFEWAEGYEPRFGLVHVDYKNQKRTIKESAHYYKHIIETNGEKL